SFCLLLASSLHIILLHSISTLFPTRRSSDLDAIIFVATQWRQRRGVRKQGWIGRGPGARVQQPVSGNCFAERRRGENFSTGHSADRKSTRLNSSHVKISYAVFCLKKKTAEKL